jgi:tetratricopeptide (TPR) repeat protein
LTRKADSLYQADNYSEAFKAYTTLISLDSLNGEFYYRRAYSSSHLSEPEFIPEDYQQSAKLGYREFDSYYNLGVIYSIVEKNDSLAVFYLEKALEERPDSEKVRLMLENLGVEDATSI